MTARACGEMVTRTASVEVWKDKSIISGYQLTRIAGAGHTENKVKG